MPRADYDVQKGAPTPADTSFRSCLLAILIFIILSLVFVLLAVLLRSSRSSEPTAPVHRDSEEVDVQQRYLDRGKPEDIDTPRTTTTATSGGRQTNGTTHPKVTTTTAPVEVTEQNASSEDSRARTVGGVGPIVTTESPVTVSPEERQPTAAPAPSTVVSVGQAARNHSSTPTQDVTLSSVGEEVTPPPAHTNTTTVTPQPPPTPPTAFVSLATSDTPPDYLPSSTSPIVVDHGPVATSSTPHHTTPNTTSESFDTDVSLLITSLTTLGPRNNATDGSLLGSESTNDSSTSANNVSATPLAPADRNETTKASTSSTTTTTTRTPDAVVTDTTNASATDRDHYILQRVVVSSPPEEQTTVVTEVSISEDGISPVDDSLLASRNDSSLTTAASGATSAGLNRTSEDSAPPAHAESDTGSPPATTDATRWVSADNSSEGGYVVDHTAHSDASVETSDREVESVPPTTTEAVATINRTTVASSEPPMDPDSALQPSVPTELASGRNVCRTDACYRQAQRMAAMMNHTVPPCRSFYVAACGGLQNDPLLQQYDPLQEAFRRIAGVTRSSKELTPAIKKLREFEESCMQYKRHMPDAESRIAEVRKVMNDIGNFSFDDGEWKNFRSKFADLFSTLIKYNSSPLFDVLLDVEGKNKPTFVFKLVPPLPGGSIFSGDRRAHECRRSASQNSNEIETDMDIKYSSYKNCIENCDIFSNTVNVVKLLGSFTDTNETAAEMFYDSLTFALSDLDKYMEIPKEATVRHEQLTKKYELTTVADLDKKFHVVDWKALFTNLVKDHHESIGEQLVQIYSIDYFSFIFEDMADRVGEHAFAKDLNNALLAYTAQGLFEDLVEQRSPCDREAYCQYVTYSLMSQAASSAYLQSFTTVDLKRMEDRANETFTLLKGTLNDEFKNAKWLDEESKTEVFEQLENINLAPYKWESFLLNNTYLDDYYKELDINPTNYFQNAVNLVLLNKKHSYSLYLKNPLLPQYIWSHFKYPYHSTGNVIYALNTVVIPIGLLSKFSNDAPLPKYINMAGEGLVMAHELAHMFDFVGMKREFHKEDLKLSSHSTSIFKGMEGCIIGQYAFKKSHRAEDGKQIGFLTNGALSANERMADYTGMLIAYNTYLKHREDSEELLPLISSWTPEQLFFLQATQGLCSKKKIYHHFPEIYEDVHMPSAIRVENMVSNSDEFSEAFSCDKIWHCEVFPRTLAEDKIDLIN